jgi:hypothetical protein
VIETRPFESVALLAEDKVPVLVLKEIILYATGLPSDVRVTVTSTVSPEYTEYAEGDIARDVGFNPTRQFMVALFSLYVLSPAKENCMTPLPTELGAVKLNVTLP